MVLATAPDQELNIDRISELLGSDADSLLNHKSETISKDVLHLPGPDFVDRVWTASDRHPQVLRSIQQMLDHGRLGGTGYLSILPVDQGIEHAAGASFAKNPAYFDPENIVKLAIEGGCNAVASTFGVLGIVARKYAHRIPFMVMINHNELLTYPNRFDQVMFGTIKEAWNMGAVAVGALVSFGSDESTRQLVQVAEAVDRVGRAIREGRIALEGPALAALAGNGIGHADGALELLQCAEDQRPVRPGAAMRDVEMVAPRLRLESGGAVGRDAVAEPAVDALERAVLAGFRGEILVAPLAVHQDSHGCPLR
jgi:hypothetical protein